MAADFRADQHRSMIRLLICDGGRGMPTISVPNPLAAYIVFGVFGGLLFGQFAIGFFVPQRYRRNRPLTLREQRAARRARSEDAAPR